MTYEYACGACGHEWEAEQRISEAPLKKCPKCGKLHAKRQISRGAGFILKGGGWYADGYGSSSGKSGGDSGGSKSESSNSTKASTTGTTTETKSESKDTSPKTPSDDSKPSGDSKSKTAAA
ncbi:MAG TPA: zinc ribbon domain-containing protein [Polyangiaceae bacterium]|jgi:putative FmdB family regulatory protein|nr:zinc ribbon domain-containing protein [Polyangiaceae bacterium]